MKISSPFLAAVLVVSFAGSALAAEAQAPAPALTDTACVEGDTYFGPVRGIEMAKTFFRTDRIVKRALEYAGYEVQDVSSGADGCLKVRYAAPGKKGYRFESMSAENPSLKGASCADAARLSIDNYLKGTRQAIVVASIKDLGEGKCRFSVYAVRPPSDALPASLGAVKLPQ